MERLLVITLQALASHWAMGPSPPPPLNGLWSSVNAVPLLQGQWRWHKQQMTSRCVCTCVCTCVFVCVRTFLRAYAC